MDFSLVVGMKINRTEAVVIAITVLILGLLCNFALQRKSGHERPRCINNLRQVSRAMGFWAYDNNERYPFEISTNLGGSKEFVKSIDTFRHFAVLSNELGDLKVLACPFDRDRKPAGDFKSLNNANVSYFVNLAARRQGPEMLLLGDRQFTISSAATNRQWRWNTDIHFGEGHVVLTDGSVQVGSQRLMSKAMKQELDLAIPQ